MDFLHFNQVGNLARHALHLRVVMVQPTLADLLEPKSACGGALVKRPSAK
jgi:hypothetical protein